MRGVFSLWAIGALGIMTTGIAGAVQSKNPPPKGPADLALTYRSEVDGTEQPYRLYLPSAYDGAARLPLFIAMHGTGGDQNKYFDHKAYGNGIYKAEAEKRGIIVVCPHGRGTTEYRGIGENDVLTVLREVCGRFLVDEDRIICSGQSMGGTGTTYLCCRYPELFAGGAPLASTYGHLALIENLRHVPMLYVQGEKDWPIYAQDGPIPIAKRLKELGYEGELWMVPGAPHNTMDLSTERVLDWALEQRRVKYPARVTFRAYLPIHGRAYWTEIQEIAEPGRYAGIDAAADANAIRMNLRNVGRVALRPEPPLFDLSAPVRVRVGGDLVFEGRCGSGQEIRVEGGQSSWTASLVKRAPRPFTAYRTHKIGVVGTPPTQKGAAETSMGSWMADMMRDASGADIAIYNRRYYRGVPFTKGQDIYIVDLLNWIRPCNRVLAEFSIDGQGLLDIIEDNILNEEGKAEFLIQVSGCRYAFDRCRPKGERIVESTIDPDRTYRVACEQHPVSRGDTMNLAGRFGKIAYKGLEITNISGSWRYILKQGGRLEGRLDGRVEDVTPEDASQ